MEDSEVIEAFLEGSGAAFGPSLHVERDSLLIDGWWVVAYRVSGRTVIVRDEPTPAESTAPADVAAALGARGLSAVGADLPAIALLAYTNLDLGFVPWMLWSTDLGMGEADLNARAGEDSSLQGGSPAGQPFASFDPVSVQGARRTAGAPSRMILTVGVSADRAAPLCDGLVDCQVESRAFGEIEPGGCASVLPSLVLVDATAPIGREFVAELRARQVVTGPVVAITEGAEMQAGADATVDAADPPDHWLPLVQALLG